CILISFKFYQIYELFARKHNKKSQKDLLLLTLKILLFNYSFTGSIIGFSSKKFVLKSPFLKTSLSIINELNGIVVSITLTTNSSKARFIRFIASSLVRP